MEKVCQKNGKTSVVVPIFKGKGDVMDCGACRGVKLLEHAMKIVERVLENRIRELVMINEMQFGFMPGKDTTHALYILRRMQEEFRGREKKLHMCVVDLEKAFDRVPRKVMEWALKKKGLAKAGVLNLFCLVYPLPKERSVIYPHCTTTALSLLKIKIFFSL